MNKPLTGGSVFPSDGSLPPLASLVRQPPVSSLLLKERIKELKSECRLIEAEMVERGQYVASHGMSDAVDGLRKALGCWNSAIEWTDEH